MAGAGTEVERWPMTIDANSVFQNAKGHSLQVGGI